MSQSSENESEILLGNKQVAGIFFLFALLLGVAFTGGYMVGRGSGKKPPITNADAESSSAAARSQPGAATRSLGQTHTVSSDDNTPGALDRSESASQAASMDKPALGSRKAHTATQDEPASGPMPDTDNDVYTPPAGTRFLQVAATGREEAETLADVLHKKGFRAHAAPKPGSTKFYRVIIGPVRDAGDLSTTRDALRKTGFREVIVQNY